MRTKILGMVLEFFRATHEYAIRRVRKTEAVRSNPVDPASSAENAVS